MNIGISILSNRPVDPVYLNIFVFEEGGSVLECLLEPHELSSVNQLAIGNEHGAILTRGLLCNLGYDLKTALQVRECRHKIPSDELDAYE